MGCRGGPAEHHLGLAVKGRPNFTITARRYSADPVPVRRMYGGQSSIVIGRQSSTR